MMSSMLTDVICKTFMTAVGKFQLRREPQKIKDSGPKFVLTGQFPEDGWLDVAQFTTEEKATAYRASSFTEDERQGHRANSLLATAVNSSIEWRRCPPVDPLPLIPMAMHVAFKTRINYDTEEGYRFLDLVIYGALNYVQVWTRTRWTVIPLEDLEYNEADDESYVKKGKSYQEGASEWTCIGDHDSGWRDSVRQLLLDKQQDIVCFDGLSNWYEVVEVEKLNLPEKTR